MYFVSIFSQNAFGERFADLHVAINSIKKNEN